MIRKTVIGLKNTDKIGAKLAKIKIVEYFEDERAIIDSSAKDKVVIVQKNPEQELGPYFGFRECDVYDDKEVMEYVSYIYHYPDAYSADFSDCIKEFKECDDEYGD